LSLTTIEVAATAPFESVVPSAVAHRPTVAAALVADTASVTVGDEVSVTVTGTALGVAGGLADG